MVRSEDGDRDAISYDSSSSDAPLLHVEHGAGGGGTNYLVRWIENP